jgi:N-acetylglucosamine-6-phosphate deacetylase
MTEDRKSESGLLLRGARLVLSDRAVENVGLLVDGGRIRAIVEQEQTIPQEVGRTIDLTGLTLFPGFIDIHIHGAVGVDTMEADADDLYRVAFFLAQNGITGWLPTLVPAPLEDYRRACAAIEKFMMDSNDRAPAARGLGLHYEGPFINSAQCGALRTAHFQTYKEPGDLANLPVIENTNAKYLITVAPEIDGGLELISELRRRGWIVSIGHTRATPDILDRASDAGAHHMTHFMNAMPPLHHRAPGPVCWGLLRDDVSVDIIADGVHLDQLVLKLLLRCKTPTRLSLISDAIAPAGLGDGEYQIWGEKIAVKDGRTQNARGSIAGSVITMLEAVRMMRSIGSSDSEVARMASLNPARLLGIDGDCGSIEAGKRADLVALDNDGKVRLTLVNGRVAFDSSTQPAKR